MQPLGEAGTLRFGPIASACEPHRPRPGNDNFNRKRKMTTPTLSTVTAKVIKSYGHITLNVIHAYRAGGQRMLGFVDQRWASAVQANAVRLNKDLRKRLIGTQQRLSGYVVAGLNTGSQRAEGVVQSAVDFAAQGVKRIAVNAERFDQASNLGAVALVNRVALPAASAASEVVGRIEQGSKQLVARVAGKPVARKAVRKTAAKRKPVATRKASTAVARKAAPKPRARVAKPVAKPVVAARRAAPKARKAAVKTTTRVAAA